MELNWGGAAGAAEDGAEASADMLAGGLGLRAGPCWRVRAMRWGRAQGLDGWRAGGRCGRAHGFAGNEVVLVG